jgi:hypothetical protein
MILDVERSQSGLYRGTESGHSIANALPEKGYPDVPAPEQNRTPDRRRTSGVSGTVEFHFSGDSVRVLLGCVGRHIRSSLERVVLAIGSQSG